MNSFDIPLAGQILNVFDAAEIELILKILKKNSDEFNAGHKKYAYTNGFTKNDLTYQLINKYVIKKINLTFNTEINLHVGVYLKEFVPWPVHSDYVKDDESPYQVYLIPLQLLPVNKKLSHTLIFDQTSKTTFKEFKTQNQPLRSLAEGWYTDHCSHEPVEDLHYLSLFGIYPWHQGSIIHWDRKMLHCSDNFLINGIKEKQALVLFTSK
jgi:hypothetical protein